MMGSGVTNATPTQAKKSPVFFNFLLVVDAGSKTFSTGFL
jgi:hypothetical protein